MSGDDNDKDKDNVKPLFPGMVTSAENLENIRRDLPEWIESQVLFAQLLRAKYLALIKEGFTKEEALELSKRLEF